MSAIRFPVDATGAQVAHCTATTALGFWYTRCRPGPSSILRDEDDEDWEDPRPPTQQWEGRVGALHSPPFTVTTWLAGTRVLSLRHSTDTPHQQLGEQLRSMDAVDVHMSMVAFAWAAWYAAFLDGTYEPRWLPLEQVQAVLDNPDLVGDLARIHPAGSHPYGQPATAPRPGRLREVDARRLRDHRDQQDIWLAGARAAVAAVFEAAAAVQIPRYQVRLEDCLVERNHHHLHQHWYATGDVDVLDAELMDAPFDVPL